MGNITNPLKKQFDEIPELRKLESAEDKRFVEWQKLTGIIIRNAFGANEKEDFEFINFWPSRVAVSGASPLTSQEKKEALVEGLDEAEAFLGALIKGREILGEEENAVREKDTEPESSASYIREEIVKGFRGKKDSFDYKKLVRLLEELNSNFAAGHLYSSSMLVRAVLDHVPPLLGCGSFEEVVSSYVWPSKAEKDFMESLRDYKLDANWVLHKQISGDQDLLEIDDLPQKVRINRLLQECLKVGGTIEPQKKPKSKSSPKPKNIQIKLAGKKSELE